MNTVQYLIEHPFVRLTYNNQVAVKNLKRPMPPLSLISKQTVKGKGTIRQFRLEIYEKNNWICGCPTRNALFCFPCLLFGGDTAWSQSGVTDLVHLVPNIKKHEISEAHLKNVLSLTFLGQPGLSMPLNSEYKQTVEQHNELVSKNRKVLHGLINSVRFCATVESSAKNRPKDEKHILQNIMAFGTNLDSSVNEHLTKSKLFQDSSTVIQNELLDIMLQVYHEEVSVELKATQYVAVMVDEIKEFCSEVQLVMFIRYINDKGNIVERFWKFLNPTPRNVDNIYECISSEIEKVASPKDFPKKLVSVSYCGAVVINNVLNDVPQRLKNSYLATNLVYSYANNTNDIISNAASSITECRIFFSNMNRLCEFLIMNRILNTLKHALNRKNAPASVTAGLKTIWDVNARFVNVVFEYREDLIEICEDLETNENTQENSVIQEAGAYARILKDEGFVFWLSVFQKLFPPVETLLNHLQKQSNARKSKSYLESCISAVHDVRLDVATCNGEINNGTLAMFDGADIKIEPMEIHIKEELPDSVFTEEMIHESPPPKRSRKVSPRSTRQADAIQIIDFLISDLKSRYNCLGHLIACDLFLTTNFKAFSDRFPEKQVEEALKCFPPLDQKQLRTELKVLYDDEKLKELKSQHASTIFKVIVQNGISSSFEECSNLLRMVLTSPMSSPDDNIWTCKLSEVKRFLRNAPNTVNSREEWLNAYGMLCCEKGFVEKIDDFNEKVIETFAQKSLRKKDFAFHQI